MNPMGHERQRIVDRYYDTNKSKKAIPLTPEKLYSVKYKLSDENFNWLFISVWLGLRPKEIDSLKSDDLCRLETLSTGLQVLWTYQTKLVPFQSQNDGKRYLLFMMSKNLQ